MEKRRFPRYQLSTPLTGVIEQNGGRHGGSVLNVSAGGFYLHLPKAPQGNLKTHGADDYGEIHFRGRNAFGFGSLVRIEKFETSLGVGFSWDKEAMDPHSTALVSELIKEQEERHTFGQVRVYGLDVVIGGLLTSALSNDVLSALRSIASGKGRVSLRECRALDSSGIELLLALRDRGVPIIEARGEIEETLRRFQFIKPDVDTKVVDE